MSWRSFLYRRLSRFVTCEMRLPTGPTIGLRSKYEVASFQDSVVHPFYWQLFAALDSPPESVVDCGANCGHFTMIADLCSRIRFGESAKQYTLIEPNPFLADSILRLLDSLGIAERSNLVRGILGSDEQDATLWIQHKNYLVSSMSPIPGASPYKIPVCNTHTAIPSGPIHVLKVDIEGGEFGLMRHDASLFERARMLFMEIHETDESTRGWFYKRLEELGFHEAGPSVDHCGQRLVFFRKV